MKYAIAVVVAICLASCVPAAKKHLLVVSYCTGFAHSSRPTGEKVLQEIGVKSGVFDVTLCENGDDVKRLMTADALAKFDGVFFNNTTGNLGIPDIKAFTDWVKAGHGFMGIHAAADTYHPNDAGGDTSYVDMIGAEFRTHGNQSENEIVVNDPKHPAAKDIPAGWKVMDEMYEFLANPRPGVHILLSITTHPKDGHAEAGKPDDFPVAWCKMYGKGRVFYTSLGHREDVWENPIYQQHLLGGIKWALGLAKGSATPANPVPARLR